MKLIKHIDFEVTLQRGDPLDFINYKISNINNYKEILVVIPYDLFYISEIITSNIIDIQINNYGLHYLIITNNDLLNDIEFTIKCKLKYSDNRLSDCSFLRSKEDDFNFIPPSNQNNKVEILNTEETPAQSDIFHNPINFLIRTKEDLEKAKQAFLSLDLKRVTIYNLIANEKFNIRSKEDFDITSKLMQNELSITSSNLEFDDEIIPTFYVYFGFKPKSLKSTPKRIIYSLHDFEKCYKDQQLYLNSLIDFPDSSQVNSVLKEKESLLINCINNDKAFYLPIFTLPEHENYLRLKKKYEERVLHKDGIFKFDFFAYTFDYDLRDIAESKLHGFFEALFENKLSKLRSLNLISLGVDYSNGGIVIDLKIKNNTFNDSAIVDEIKSEILNTKLSEYKSNFYVIYFFETYFISSS